MPFAAANIGVSDGKENAEWHGSWGYIELLWVWDFVEKAQITTR